MTRTIRYIKNSKHFVFTLPDQEGKTYPPLNVRVNIDDNIVIRILSTNAIGYAPYITNFVPVLTPAKIPNPLTYLSAEHNFNLGGSRLLLMPSTGRGGTTFLALFAASELNAGMAQPQPPPVVTVWISHAGCGAAAALAASSLSSAASASWTSVSTAAASLSSALVSAASVFGARTLQRAEQWRNSSRSTGASERLKMRISDYRVHS